MTSERDPDRSYERIEDADLERLGMLARNDREKFFAHNPRWRVYATRIVCVALCQGAVPHHVSEHDGSEFPLLCVLGRHERTKAETARNETGEFAKRFGRFRQSCLGWPRRRGSPKRYRYDVKNDPQPSRISPTARRPQTNRVLTSGPK